MVVNRLLGTCGAALLLGLVPLTACKVDNAPAGGLVLSLETDLAVPKDIDRIHLSIAQDGRVVREEDHAIGSGQTLLPAELRVAYPGNERPLLIQATAYRGDEARIERSAITPVPRSFIGLLRLPFSYLCDGTALSEGGSSCGPGNTCNMGSCGTAALDVADLPQYQPQRPAAQSGNHPLPDGGLSPNQIGDGSPDAAASGCFDVSACFASAQLVEIDVTTCTFQLPPEAASERVSVSLVLPLGSAGICDNGSCFVPLDLDSGGYSFGDGGDVLLPQGVCDKLLTGVPLRAAVSVSCGPKTSKHPPCGAWSSVKMPLPARDSGSGGPGAAPGRSGLGEACAGSARQACGRCGTQARECRDGRWDDWGACRNEGSCTPGMTEACGRGGSRTCGGNCEWSACQAQTCSGPSSQACGNCGTQTRNCDNGVWSAWSACEAQGECQPNDTRGCGSSGTQACMGNCRWGSCGDQSCAGAPSEACGMCGTRTRSCDASSGMWSVFGACSDEGACVPNTTRACGNGGMQACRGDCQWESACTGQSCNGPRTRACGNCGTQMRNCDSNTGTWSEWSACNGEGQCEPNDTRACGSNGTQVCGGNCEWDAACSGQTCSGVARQGCGNCGTQTRSCDSNSGTWSEFSECANQGACRPGAARGCGSGGTQVCTTSCQWPTTCTGQECSGPPARECGNCGMQTRTCNTSTGQYGDWSACTGGGSCSPGATRTCGGTGTQACSDSCEWSAACSCPAGSHLCGGQCVSNASPGSCGTACSACPAPAGTVATCDGASCGLGCSGAGQTLCGRSCTNLQNDAANCGRCGNPCPLGEVCSAGVCGCPAGQHRCDGACVSNSALATCGTSCTTPCTAPAGATPTCDGTSCGFMCPANRTMCSGNCVDTASDNNHCGMCGTMCSNGNTCQNGRCACAPGTHLCGTQCVSNMDPNNCGSACTPCAAPDAGTATCDGVSCGTACGPGTHNCSGACVSDTSTSSCGTSCTPCTAPAGFIPTCDGVSCGTSCAPGTHNCSGTCVPDSSITQCGATCVQCPTLPNGTPVCEAGSCGIQCSTGLTLCTDATGAPVCVDTKLANDHCGACGVQCVGPQYCDGQGVCRRPLT